MAPVLQVHRPPVANRRDRGRASPRRSDDCARVDGDSGCTVTILINDSTIRGIAVRTGATHSPRNHVLRPLRGAVLKWLAGESGAPALVACGALRACWLGAAAGLTLL